MNIKTFILEAKLKRINHNLKKLNNSINVLKDNLKKEFVIDGKFVEEESINESIKKIEELLIK
jgi:hypothetical protein